ncbi:MAG: hypothetical protein ABIR11_08335 [Candidatus Limnocylindrales bacterium]
MPSTPTTLGELFRSLGLTLTIRPVADEEDAWGCTLTRPDGATYEIDSVTFFDVDPDTGDEWAVEPSPSRVLSVLAGGDIEAEEEDGADDDADGAAPGGGAPEAEAEAAARAFLGDAAYDTLQALDAAGLE